MITFYYIFSGLLVFFSIIPLIQNQHWFFRFFDFAKVQILFFQTVIFIFAWWFISHSTWFYIMQVFLIACMIYECFLLYKYTPLYPLDKKERTTNSSKSIDVLSANVYQFNTKYDNFIQLVGKSSPDIVVTMESNKDWENALQVLKTDYPHFVEVGLENTYGIHLYSKFPFAFSKVHYFVADDLPSIEVLCKTSDGFTFRLFGVHPPPPSPTEEENSKERDGELLAVAKEVRKKDIPTVVVGDFNNVAWAKSSILFRKTAQMIDPRIGRGLISTFHAKYWFLRFPIDQMFHSTDIFVEKIKALENFGSDHLPLYVKFFIDKKNGEQEDEVEDLEKGDMKEVNKLIQEGKKEESDREEVITE